MGSFDAPEYNYHWKPPWLRNGKVRLPDAWVKWMRDPASDAREAANMARYREHRDQKQSGQLD